MLKIKDTCFRLCLGFHAPSFFLDAKIDKKLVQGQPGHSISFELLLIRQQDVCLLNSLIWDSGSLSVSTWRLGQKSPMPFRLRLGFYAPSFFLDSKIDKKIVQGQPEYSICLD